MPEPAQLFLPSLGRQAAFSSLPRQAEGKPGATLWFNDKGTLGSRRAPMKDAPLVLGAMMKEDSELNLAILTLERDLAGAGEWLDQSQCHA